MTAAVLSEPVTLVAGELPPAVELDLAFELEEHAAATAATHVTVTAF